MHREVFKLSDITKHKWESSNVFSVEASESGIYLIPRIRPSGIMLSKNDAIAIAKHFCSQLQTIQERMDFFQAMSGELKWDAKNRLAMSSNIPQSETTYNSEIREIKTNEPFNKEADLHE